MSTGFKSFFRIAFLITATVSVLWVFVSVISDFELSDLLHSNLESLRKGSLLGPKDAQSQFYLAERYFFGIDGPQNYVKAFKWYTKSAEQGHSQAQCILGVMYHKGEGVSVKYADARKWFTKAAEQGHSQAQCNLGIMYYKGEGVSVEYAEAKKWFTKAAEQGHPQAQNNLGYMYYNGEGAPKNYFLAYVWSSLASAQDHELFSELTNTIEQMLPPKKLVEAQALAIKIKDKIDNPNKTSDTLKNDQTATIFLGAPTRI